MKKFFVLKSLLMLCALFGGVGNAIANDYDYEWVKVTNLSEVATGDVVVLVSSGLNIALPNNDNDFKGVSVTLSAYNRTISSNVSDAIQWTVTNDNGAFTFRRGGTAPLYAQLGNSPKLGVGDGGATSVFSLENYGSSGGLLSCSSNPTYYLYWSYINPFYKAELHEGQNYGNYLAEVVLYKKTVKKYTKWKEVSFANLTAGSTVVIVDKTTGLAMTNDKGDKKPGTSAVELNADKDRIMGDVASTIQWTVEKADGNVRFKVGDNYLQYDASSLSTGTDKTNNFTGIKYNCLRTEAIDSKFYNVGLKNSFMSNSWEVKEEGNDAANDDIKDTWIAFYQKVDDPQKKVTLKFGSDEYYADLNASITLSLTCTGTDASNVEWTSSNTSVATVSDGGVVTLKARGTVTITARVAANDFHDKASATCTVKIDNTGEASPGSKDRPFTVAQARELAKEHTINVDGYGTVTWTEGTCYYIQGVISKVSGGIFDMFGDMEIPGMDDTDFDMDDLGGIAIPGMTSSSGTCSYYISDNGTKDNHMKVVDGHGLIINNAGGALSYGELKPSDMSPGDKVTVYGPLIYTEDTSMFSGLGGNNNSEPKYSAKVGTTNGMYAFTQGLVVVNDIKDMKNDTQRNASELYTCHLHTAGTADAATYKSKDEEVVKFEEEGEGNSKHMVMKALKEGDDVKVTVKVKVIVTPDDKSTTEVNEEKSYTMKRSLLVTVTSRDKAPEGLKAGHYALVTNLNQLLDGDKIIIVGEEESTSYIMKSEDSKMGGKEGVETQVLSGIIGNVPNGALELTLERTEGTANNFRFRNSNGDYLYASDKPADGNVGFDMTSLFGGSGGKLKFGTIAAQGDSLKATIVITNIGQYYRAKIAFNIADRKKTEKNDQDQDVEVDVKANKYVKFTTKLDFDLSLFGGGGESGSGTGDFDISSLFSSFATPAFSAQDEDDTKHSHPYIYRWVPDNAFEIVVGESRWATLVSAFDVTLAENGVAYVVTNVADGKATLTRVTTSLKAGEPYLINAPDVQGQVTLTKTTGAPKPEVNLLKVSDGTTSGESGTSTVYVMGVKKGTTEARFYKWAGGLLGRGRVYLPAPAGAPSFITFDLSDATAITDTRREAITDNQYYTLDGRRVEHPTKGLYIVNGKKVMVK